MSRSPVPQARPPRWPLALLALFGVLATLALAQGIVDVVVPTLRGEEPFGFLFGMTEAWGMPFFTAYIFLHNVGLASIVPGFGFIAARFERKTSNRYVIGLLLLGAVVVSILVAAQFVVMESARFDLPVAATLLVGEACGVLALSWAAARELKGFVPTRAYEWSLVTPFRNLRVPLAYSFSLLLILSVWEAYAVLGA